MPGRSPTRLAARYGGCPPPRPPRSGCRSGVDGARPAEQRRDAGARAHPELREHARDVLLDGALAEMQAVARSGRSCRRRRAARTRRCRAVSRSQPLVGSRHRGPSRNVGGRVLPRRPLPGGGVRRGGAARAARRRGSPRRHRRRARSPRGGPRRAPARARPAAASASALRVRQRPAQSGALAACAAAAPARAPRAAARASSRASSTLASAWAMIARTPTGACGGPTAPTGSGATPRWAPVR